MSPFNSSIEAAEPFDGGPYMTESGWTTTFSLALSNGCIDQGNGLQVYSDQDGKQVKVPAGRYLIRGHIYTLASTKVIPIATVTGNDRYDTIVVRLDTLNKQVYVDVVQGQTLTGAVPTSGPPIPSLTQVPGGIWEERLSNIYVNNANGYIYSGNVSDERTWAGVARWTDYLPNVFAVANGSAQPAVQAHPLNRARYQVNNDMCRVSYVASTKCSSGPSLTYAISLPVYARYPSVSGSALVQDYPAGLVYTQPNNAVAGFSDSNIGMVFVQKVNAFNLTCDGTTYFFDAFDISYEIAPGALGS